MTDRLMRRETMAMTEQVQGIDALELPAGRPGAKAGVGQRAIGEGFRVGLVSEAWFLRNKRNCSLWRALPMNHTFPNLGPVHNYRFGHDCFHDLFMRLKFFLEYLLCARPALSDP